MSTGIYYDRINREVQKRAGSQTSPPMCIESLDFRALHGIREDEGWERIAELLSDSAKRLQASGADGLIIAANSMHKVYEDVAETVDIPILHIADLVGKALRMGNHTNAALIGTRNVMTESFYRKRLVAEGIDLLPPDMANAQKLDEIIYDELMVGRVTRDAERALKTIITNKAQEGAGAIVLACTELNLVVDVNANILPVYDSARIHCDDAVDWILEGDEVN